MIMRKERKALGFTGRAAEKATGSLDIIGEGASATA